MGLAYFSLLFFTLFSLFHSINAKCLHDQLSHLLRLKDGFSFHPNSQQFTNWNQTVDCCEWGGVECDVLGRVVSLELIGDDESDQMISIRNENWKAVFSLQHLEKLSLARNNFTGVPIPMELYNLTKLQHLDLSYSGFSGPIPIGLSKLNNLVTLNLSGPVRCHMGDFPKSRYCIMRTSHLLRVSNRGGLKALFQNLTELREVHLDWVNISAGGSDWFSAFSHMSKLQVLSLRACKLSGPIPATMANLSELVELVLSNNQFSGPIPAFQESPKLEYIDLSGNFLSGKVLPSLFSLPSLFYLSISNNNLDGWMDEFPNASSSLLKMDEIDLSHNVIAGEIPNWLWNPYLQSVNLSYNLLTGIQKPYTFPNSIRMLDLHSNMLEGKIPSLPTYARYVDYSNNNLNSSIPSNIGNGSRFQPKFFSLSNNSISGGIPDFICNLTSDTILDFSNNFLRGVVPECVCTIKGVLNLSGNKLSGHIPDAFRDNCGLRTLDLSQNAFIGKMPLSLVNCKPLKVVNVGDNYLEDNFPCKLIEGQSLSVVVIRSNRFHGEITCQWNKKGWTNLRLLDVSHNNFNGTLPSQLFLMMVDDNSDSSPLKYEGTRDKFHYGYYKDSVKLVLNGRIINLDLHRILSKQWRALDFSSNGFQGKIPKEIGTLRGLVILSMSYNALTDTIPASVGNLVELEYLDLSRNQLAGRIPSELVNLTFLSFLNLSYNQLTGEIPNGRQFATFTELCFLGNRGLCGPPLSSCDHGSPTDLLDRKEIDWEYVCASLGFSVGLRIILLLMFLNPEWWQRFNTLIIRFLILRVFCVQVQERRYKNPIPRL